MLLIVIISNGYLQTLVSQFALGASLKLHPLVVLFATTAGSLLFGVIGGVFAAPFLKIFLDADRAPQGSRHLLGRGHHDTARRSRSAARSGALALVRHLR